DRRAASLADQFEPALGAVEMRQRREGGGRLAAGRDDEPRCHQRVLDLELAGKRQAHTVIAPGVLQRERLREAIDPALEQTDALPAPADADEPQVAPPRRRRDD